MTLAPHRPTLEVGSLEEVLAALRERGLRVSAARRIVLEGLYAADGPASAEALAAGMDGAVPVSDVASVYRNLELLERLGIVRHVHLGHGPGLYALAGREVREHLVCERCGELRSVDAAELDPVRDQIRAAFGFEARFTHFPIAGLCARCVEEAGPAADAGAAHEHGH